VEAETSGWLPCSLPCGVSSWFTAAPQAASQAVAASNASSRTGSDRRLKREIVAAGRTDRALRLHRYINDNVCYVGVMAQELATRVPACAVAEWRLS